MSRGTSDRNLLVGMLAFQNGFVRREQLLSAMSAWLVEKETPLEEMLLRQGALDADKQQLLIALVRQHLAMHDKITAQSLAAVSSLGSVCDELRSLADPELNASLVHVTADLAGANGDRFATVPPTIGASTSQGGRFRILRPHARGGLGEVHVALDTELNREVALKEIQSRHADHPQSRARFTLEAEITGGLEHPGIVPVYGLGTYADGRPYYAMRFIRGDSLAEKIERFHKQHANNHDESARTLELHKLLRRFIDVCEAIQYAHDRGILHRDLKPGNIMLGKYGETLVVDWGLAKALGTSRPRSTSVDPPATTLPDEPPLVPKSVSGATPTEFGTAVGTPAFMSPEQASGRIEELGPASDVYSLGATLYSLLTGRPPFAIEKEGTSKLLRRVIAGDFPRPRQMSPSIPQPLDAICLKAMATKPADRYSTPAKLRDDLEHWMADEPVNAHVDTLVERSARFVRKHRSWALATAAALLLVALVSTAAAVLVNDQKNEIADLAADNFQLAEDETAARKEAEIRRNEAEAAQSTAEKHAKRVSELSTLTLRFIDGATSSIIDVQKGLVDERNAELLYRNIVIPAQELAETHGKHELFDSAASMIAMYPRSNWTNSSHGNKPTTAAEQIDQLYTMAIDVSGGKVGEYFKKRADARLMRQPPVFEQVLADAAELKRFKPFEGQAFAIEGNVLFLQSRGQETLPDRYKYLNLALKALQTAESLSAGEGQLSQNGLDHAQLLLSMAHSERGNFAGLFASDSDGYKIVPKQEFQKAIDYAQEVIKRGGGPRLQYAYVAAANAYEDMAWHVREMAVDNFAKAVENLRYSVAYNDKSADAHVALARCYYKMVVEVRVNPPKLKSDFAGHLDAAEGALKNAIVLAGDQKDPEMHLWLGKVIQASHVDERTSLEAAKSKLTAEEYRDADEQFAKAFNAAKMANMSPAYLAAYALARAEHALLNPSIKLKNNASESAITDIVLRAKDLAALKDATTVRFDPLQEALILQAKADLHTKTPVEVIESLQPHADNLAKIPVDKLTRSDVKLMEFRLGLQSPLRPDQLTRKVVESAVEDALWYATAPAALVAADRVGALVTAIKFNRQIVVNDKSYLAKSLTDRVACLKKLASLPIKDDVPLHQFVVYECNEALKSAKPTPEVDQELRVAGKAYLDKAIASAKAKNMPATEIEKLNQLLGLFE